MGNRSNKTYTPFNPKPVGESSFTLPYIAIIIIGLIFWPAGILLLIGRLYSDRKALLLAAGIVSLFGWVLLIFGSLLIFGFMVGQNRHFITSMDVIMLTICFLLATGGIALLITGGKLRRNAKRYKLYISIVWNGGVTEFGRIAQIVSRPYDTVKKDLQRMIDHKFLPDGYLDHGEGKIVLPGLNDDEEEEIIDVISCKNCGAHKKLKRGSIAVCDFCGSKLKAG